MQSKFPFRLGVRSESVIQPVAESTFRECNLLQRPNRLIGIRLVPFSRRGNAMTKHLAFLTAAALAVCLPATSRAACCYFSAKNADILQPSQKVFIPWDPAEKVETFTV